MCPNAAPTLLSRGDRGQYPDRSELAHRRTETGFLRSSVQGQTMTLRDCRMHSAPKENIMSQTAYRD